MKKILLLIKRPMQKFRRRIIFPTHPPFSPRLYRIPIIIRIYRWLITKQQAWKSFTKLCIPIMRDIFIRDEDCVFMSNLFNTISASTALYTNTSFIVLSDRSIELTKSLRFFALILIFFPFSNSLPYMYKCEIKKNVQCA